MPLYSSLSTSHRVQAAEFKRHAYATNGWGRMQRWDGRSAATVNAGITGPSQEVDSWTPSPTTAAGDTTVGVHVVRYRYLDSATGYVSNPSEEREVTVASGAESLTFAINNSGAANIVRSSDSKVDRIVVEMTTVDGSEFFKAAEALESASTVVVNISDESLELQFLPWPEDGNDPPPVAKNIVSHRDRIWLFTQVAHSTGTCDVTNASVDVGEGGTGPDWNADALGDDTASPVKTASVAWLFQRDGDTAVYEIDYFDESLNKIVLKSAYQGSTGNDVAYQIFSRANVIWVSEPGYPEAFAPLRFLNGPNGELAGDLTAGVGYGSNMVFFSLSGMSRIAWDVDPLVDAVQLPISTKRGALNQRVVVEVEGVVYAMDYLGWHAWSGVFPQHISRAIDEVHQSIDYDQAENFHCCWFPKIRAIRWFVCYVGETYPKHYVQYDVDTQSWSTGEYKQGISESRLVPTSGGPVVYYGDENGYVWIADVGTADGCDPDLSHVTVAASSTATLLFVDEALPSNSSFGGCYAYWVEGEEYALVASNSDSAITLDGIGFSSAPADGDEIWIGPIPAKLKTRAYTARRGLSKVRQPKHLWVTFQPEASARTLQCRVYDDYSSTAREWRAGGNDLPGLTAPNATTDDWLIDLSQSDGVVKVPIGDKFVRTFEAELEIIEPDATVELISIEHDGQEMERQAV